MDINELISKISQISQQDIQDCLLELLKKYQELEAFVMSSVPACPEYDEGKPGIVEYDNNYTTITEGGTTFKERD